ncbi:hypothetical protein F2Q69_00031631 [Brassica cretica]|uniref:Zinc knuckle CX2CX4HX4C domain-containing protein n=1 Tax=Brassica cretica TaxID=69181 RepID=A0A8S9S418_BRACR|nr:hypothetical protein F2Q69_00031631 [Brassica cretica]
MAHRYTRAEKGKGKEVSSRSERQRPIQIPQSDDSALIKENKLTLIGRLPIQLPSGEVISVNLEYEKLEKHCFLCYSLCHEKENCPQNKDDTGERSPQGINQKNTLRKLEEHRCNHDNKRSISLSSRDRVSDPREQRSNQRSVYSRLQEPLPSSAKSVTIQKSLERQIPSEQKQGDMRHISSGHNTQSSRTPPSRPAREAMNLPAAPDQEEVISERIEEVPNQAPERISALERIEAPMDEEPRPTGLSSSMLARLQDVEITYEAEDNQSPLIGVGGARRTESTSSPQAHQESPRISASLKLGSSSGSRKRSNP